MTSAARLSALGGWRPGDQSPAFAPVELARIGHRVRESVHVVRDGAEGRVGVALGGQTTPDPASRYPLLATLPALFPEWLGDRAFCEVHGVRFPYVAGAMANGIATPELVIAMARAEMLGFYGAGGLSLDRIEAGLDRIEAELGREGTWGANLIHAPHEPELEAATADLYLRRGVRRVSASAYMSLTAPIVRYACAGLHADPAGRVLRKHHVFAKVSRPEVARLFMAPAPADVVAGLVRAGQLTEEEARLAARVPLAEDVTAEADSGGHTDNRPLTALLPLLLALRDELHDRHGFDRPVRVGAAGGLGTPGAVAGAFAMGAAYVLTGTVNQSAVEAGLSVAGKELLAEAGMADVTMAPSPDMFELGVKVQVLRRGTLFAQRAARLYELYQRHAGLDDLPADARQQLEQQVFQRSLDDVWAETRRFWAARGPAEVDRAERDPKHLMALCFRWYVGLSSRWAIAGDPGRRLDYQIWCGPVMGAFNRWVAGSFLEPVADRTVVQIARNLLEGAAVLTRAQQLRSHGVAMPRAAFDFRPRRLA